MNMGGMNPAGRLLTWQHLEKQFKLLQPGMERRSSEAIKGEKEWQEDRREEEESGVCASQTSADWLAGGGEEIKFVWELKSG